eukprot:4774081-Amphidinium_carterae.1
MRRYSSGNPRSVALHFIRYIFYAGGPVEKLPTPAVPRLQPKESVSNDWLPKYCVERHKGVPSTIKNST